MIVTLGAEVDVRIVFVGERIRSGQKEIIGRRQRLAEVVRVNGACHHIGPDMFLVGVVAGDTGNPNGAGFVSGGQGAVLDQRLPDSAGMATTAT